MRLYTFYGFSSLPFVLLTIEVLTCWKIEDVFYWKYVQVISHADKLQNNNLLYFIIIIIIIIIDH